MGAMLGYNTIICDTGSQLGIGEDSMSITAGAAGGSDSTSPDSELTKSLFKRMFAFMTYQRTRKIDLPKILILLHNKLEVSRESAQ